MSHRGLCPQKIYTIRCSWHIKILQGCSGPMGPVILMYSLTQMPKQSDPCLRYPHHMILHGGWKVLYLCHGNYASELSEVPLNPPKGPLDLSCWEVPCYCYSPGGSSCGLWTWAAPVPCIIGRSHGSHICTQHNDHPSKTLLYKNMIYIYQKDIKITYTNKKKTR
jgi:hypothetical protein